MKAGRVPQDPEEEWESGMISFELAWMRKLAPVAPAYAEAMLSELRNYAEEGRPERKLLIKAERLARSRAALAHLPNPWEAS